MSEIGEIRLSPEDTSFRSYRGFLKVSDCTEIYVRISNVSTTSLPGELTESPFAHATIEVAPDFFTIFGAKSEKLQQILKQRLQQCESVLQLELEFQEIFQRNLQQSNDNKSWLPGIHYYETILHEIDEIGWHQLQAVNAHFNQLEIVMMDRGNRSHVLTLQLSENYPKEAPQCRMSLPPHSSLESGDFKTLSSILQHFHTQLQSFQLLWDSFDEIDNHCWVLEPSNPTRADLHRRIVIAKHVSIQLKITNPTRPHSNYEVAFFGSHAEIIPLKEKWNRNAPKWKDTDSMYNNLQNILQVKLPSPRTSTTEEFKAECGICYSYQQDISPPMKQDKKIFIPDEICENSKCGRLFHRSCLFEWLRAMPSSRQSFNTIFGACPYCQESINVKCYK